jgi:large subunit ribosomal protein LP1
MMMVKMLPVILLFYSGEKIGKLVNASGVKMESFWFKLFAKAIEGKDISSFFNFSGSSSAASSAPVPAAKTSAPVEKKAEEKGGKKK